MDQFGIGDVRVAERGAWLLDQIVATGSVVLRELGEGRAGEIAAHRYLSSPYVSVAGIAASLSARTGAACKGRRVVVAQDTTEVNFAGRDRKRRGLGVGSDGNGRGFFIHSAVAIDVEEATVLGLVHAQIWTRSGERVSVRHSRPVEEKESLRWITTTQATAEQLGAVAAQVVMVADRESDIYSHFARCPAQTDQLIRVRHDRALEDDGTLFTVAAQWPAYEPVAVKVAPRGPGDKGRTAMVEARSGRVRLMRPHTAGRHDPAMIELTLVEVREVSPPPGVTPLLWRLLTTLPADDADATHEIVQLYRLRWRIEEVFRALKSDGLCLEDSQIVEAQRLFHLAALALGAAIRIIQLVDARDGSSRPMSDVLDQHALEAVEVITRSREGATAKQKNHHPPGSLAWLAWTVARFGGWNCYGKPPGPKTMARGWERFAATLTGFILANSKSIP